jgi:hypothetical protein
LQSPMPQSLASPTFPPIKITQQDPGDGGIHKISQPTNPTRFCFSLH